MILLDVGVTMPSRLEHPGNVALKPGIGIITTSFLHKCEEFSGESVIQGVLPGLEELMIMDPALPPVLGLITEDIPLLVERVVFRSPENAARMGTLGLHEAVHSSIVPVECHRVVIPMDRHRQSISSKRTLVSLDPTRNSIHRIKRLYRLG